MAKHGLASVIPVRASEKSKSNWVILELPCLPGKTATGGNPTSAAPHVTTGWRSICAFAQGHFHLLILVGAGGLAKSRSVRQRWTARHAGSRATPPHSACTPSSTGTETNSSSSTTSMRLYADRSGVRLLKCLCQTEEEKAVAWHSDARSLERQSIPREFTTKSRVVIISNDWQTLNKNVAAPRTGACDLFHPGAAEVHRRPGSGSTTMRSTSGLPPTCTGCVSRRCGTMYEPRSSRPPAWTGPRSWPPRPRTAQRLAAELLASAAYGSTAARVKAFVEQGGGAGRRSSITSAPSTSEDNAGYVPKLVMWSPANRCPGSSPFSIWNAT